MNRRSRVGTWLGLLALAVCATLAAPSTPAQAVTTVTDQESTITFSNNKCLEVAGSSTADGAQVQIYDCNGSGAQKWISREYPDGRPGVAFYNAASGKCLDLQNNNHTDGARIQLWPCNNGDGQRWIFTNETVGSPLELSSYGSPGCVDVPNRNFVNGQAVQYYRCNSSPAQNVSFQQASVSSRPIYAIAHNLNDPGQVYPALAAGYNAIEADAWWGMPSNSGVAWWAHDGDVPASGSAPRFQDLASRIIAAKNDHKNITFVWIDVKNAWSGGSFAANQLLDLAHQFTNNGIAVVFEMSGDEGNAQWTQVANDVAGNGMEGLFAANDSLSRTQSLFDATNIPQLRRFTDRGAANLALGCATGPFSTDTSYRDRGDGSHGGRQLGGVMAFTLNDSGNSTNCMASLLSQTGVDGIILGHDVDDYQDDGTTRGALAHYADWITWHPDQVRMATDRDNIFG